MKLLECGRKEGGWRGGKRERWEEGDAFLKNISLCPYLFQEQYCFVLLSKVHINHFIGLNCPVKIKMIPNCSRITQGLFSVQYVREAETDAQEESGDKRQESQEEEDYNQ